MQRSWNDFGMSLSNVVAGAIFAGVMLECHLFFRGRCSINDFSWQGQCLTKFSKREK